MRNFSSVWLVGDAQAGMFNGSAAPDESNQSLTFVIAYSPMSFFLTPPRIEVSNLTFHPQTLTDLTFVKLYFDQPGLHRVQRWLP